MRIAFYTLGCKYNQSESASLAQQFHTAGWQVVESGEEADVFVVNSCIVTAAGEAKSRRRLLRARRENPAAIIVLTGCLPQAFAEKAGELGADIVTGTAGRGRLLGHIEHFLATGDAVVDITAAGDDGFEELPPPLPSGRTRAFVRIQDGCSGRCAYCIIPAARGPVRSRPPESILSELRFLEERGCREVVYTGINLPSYGADLGLTLADAVLLAEKTPAIARLRLSSLDPHRVTSALAARLAGAGALCPHFHLSLQSGCDATLARMRRPYTTAQYAEAVAQLRHHFPGASFTTDIIVGFPGESDADFEESLRFAESIGFLKVHVFPFSPRPGTPAAGFPGQLPRGVKAARAADMQQALDRQRTALLAGCAGGIEPVLLEAQRPDGFFTGYTPGYLPVLADAPGCAQGDIVHLRLGQYDSTAGAVLAVPVAHG